MVRLQGSSGTEKAVGLKSKHIVVLAAGDLETPRILQNSGIGEAGKGSVLMYACTSIILVDKFRAAGKIYLVKRVH